jgi:hypothetical protein
LNMSNQRLPILLQSVQIVPKLTYSNFHAFISPLPLAQDSL